MKKIITAVFLFTSIISCQNKTSTTNTATTDTLKVDTTVASSGKQKFERLCYYDSISDQFDYQLWGYVPTGYENDDNHVSLSIFTKKEKRLVQTINFEKAAAFHYDCASYSFINGYHSIDTISDGIYGDVVTADFNFDGREDFALAFDLGFSEFYMFYLQENGQFVKNNFLTDSVGLIPEIDPTNKKLSTWIRLGATRISIQEFGYDSDKKQYTLLKSHVEDFDGNVIDSADVFHEEEK